MRLLILPVPLVVVCLFVFLRARSADGSASSQPPYRLGNFAVVQKQKTSTTPISTSIQVPRNKQFWQRQMDKAVQTLIHWNEEETRLRLFRLAVFLFCTKNSVVSILDDTWELERHPGTLRRDVNNPFVRRNVAKRVERDRYLRKLVGAGYTPRLVWLYGVMLRGVLQCTAIPKVFNPPIGWGAGATLASKFAVREWLPCILLGWYGSEWYWKTIFGVKGAPKPATNNKDESFNGVPIAIQKVTLR